MYARAYDLSISFEDYSVDKHSLLFVSIPSTSKHARCDTWDEASIPQPNSFVGFISTTIRACNALMDTIRVVDPSHVGLAEVFTTTSKHSWSTSSESDITVTVCESLGIASWEITCNSWKTLEFFCSVYLAWCFKAAADIIWNLDENWWLVATTFIVIAWWGEVLAWHWSHLCICVFHNKLQIKLIIFEFFK